MSKTTAKMLLFAEIDVGSLTTKAILMRDRRILCHCIIQTGFTPHVYMAGKDFEYVKKYGMLSKGTLIIHESGTVSRNE